MACELGHACAGKTMLIILLGRRRMSLAVLPGT